MPTVDELVEQAKMDYRAGRAAAARARLLGAVQRDPNHVDAWLWLSGMVDTLEEQQICLENVLALNPAHERARKGMASVQQKLAAARAGGALPPAPDRDPGAPVTSVEWSRSDAPPAYGSGKQVSLPSGEEYDAWVHALHLADAVETAAPAEPFTEDELRPFGDTAYMVNTGPFVEGAPLSWTDRGARRAEDGRPHAAQAGPGASDRQAAWPARPDTAAPPPSGQAAPAHEFSFGAGQAAILAEAVPAAPSAPAAANPSPTELDAAYAYIPAEITAPRRGRRSLLLLLAAVILVIANAAAVFALLGAL